MIRDHNQLSTLKLKNVGQSKVETECLTDIELYDCRESLFERLFRICVKKGWTHVYDTLTFHGRMHEDIADFVNKSFYDDVLRIATDRQHFPLDYKCYNKDNRRQDLIANHRTAFSPVREVDNSNLSDKINVVEAESVVSMVENIIELYNVNDKAFDPQKTIGIITPYRNQIALIKHKLRETGLPEADKIMVDTVERFQGSQRDIIILSFCFNRPYQLNFFANMNREGTVDRKLNVALTRAREQLFLIGNDYILRQNPIYKKILESI